MFSKGSKGGAGGRGSYENGYLSPREWALINDKSHSECSTLSRNAMQKPSGVCVVVKSGERKKIGGFHFLSCHSGEGVAETFPGDFDVIHSCINLNVEFHLIIKNLLK